MKRFHNRGKFDPYAAYATGDLFEKRGKWFVVGRDGSARPVVAEPDPVLDREPRDGVDGRDGRDGRNGRDGAPGSGFNFRGEWLPGIYEVNDIVEHDGSAYVCTAPTTVEPPDGGWALLVARGKDGAQYFSTRTIRPTVVGMGPINAIFDSNTSKGQVLFVSGGGHVELAQANGRPQAFAVGIAIENVAAGQFGQYVTSGPVSCETWSLAPGAVYYLDPSSPGGMTTTYPATAGQFVVILGAATTATQLNLQIHWLLEQS